MARPTRSRTRDPFTQSEILAPIAVLSQASAELYYDYAQLPTEHREAVRRSARIIKPLLKRTAEDIFIIGGELRAVKEMLPHGRYTEWLEVEFGLSERMAQHFVNVRERLGPKSEKFSVLPPSTLYLLAAPSTPDQAITIVEERIDAGDRVSVAHVQRTIAEQKKLVRQGAPGRMTIDGEATVLGGTVDGEQDGDAWGVDAVMNSEDASMPYRYLEGVLTELLNAVERKGTLALVTWNLVMHSRDMDTVHVKLQKMRDRVRAELRKSEKRQRSGQSRGQSHVQKKTQGNTQAKPAQKKAQSVSRSSAKAQKATPNEDAPPDAIKGDAGKP
jgi:hypothetical protein